MNPDIQGLIERVTRLEEKALRVDLPLTEKENLKNNLFEGFGDPTSTDTKTYFKIIWKDQPYFVPTGKIAPSYAGYVNLDGTAGNLPAGWTSSRTGTGQYTITHNLGTANYSALAMAVAAVAFCKFNSVNANDVQYVFLSDGGSLTDTKFYFILIPF